MPEVLTFTGTKTISDLNISAGTYVFNVQKRETTGPTSSLFIFYHNDTVIGQETFTSSTLSRTMTFADTITSVRLYSQSSNEGSTGISITYTGLMLSKEGGEYAPYNCIQVKKCNKNLYAIGNKSDYTSNLEVSINNLVVDNNKLSNKVTESNGTYIIKNQKYYINDFYISANYDKSNNTPRFLVKPFDDNDNLISNVSIEGWTYNNYYGGYFKNGNGNFSLLNAKYVQIGFIWTGNASEIGTYSNIMLAKGSTSTDYIPHQSKAYNFPLSSGQKLMEGSTIQADGIHHVRGEVVLDGSETWTEGTAGSNYNKFYTQALLNLKKPGISNIISNYFKSGTIEFGGEKNTVTGNTLNGNIYFCVDNTVVSTLQQWKDWLAEQYANGTPVILEYELAEEIIEPFTTEQKAVYDEIMSDGTYEGVTYYSTEATINPDIDMTYYKDLQIALNELETDINNLDNTVVKKANYIIGTSAPTTSTVAPFVGALYLDTTNNNTYQCTAITTENNTTTYTWVKLIRETDTVVYGSSGSLSTGLVTLGNWNNQNSGGIVALSTTRGRIAIRKANYNHINNRTASDYIDGGSVSANHCFPITPANLDYAVKAVLTGSKLEWTAEEKAAARSLLGIE